MKAFLFALVFFGLAVVAAGFVFEYAMTYTATEAYSLESARPGAGGVEHRAGWSDDV